MPPVGYIAGQAAEGVLNNIGNIITTSMYNKAAMRQAQYSYEQQQAMIEKQNQYNLPVNQMQRYQDAGLNPNLIYGQITPGLQQAIPKYEAAPLKKHDVALDFVDKILDIKTKVENLKAAKYNAEIMGYNAGLKGIEFGYQSDIYGSGLRREKYEYEVNRLLGLANVYNLRADELITRKKYDYPSLQKTLVELALQKQYEKEGFPQVKNLQMRNEMLSKQLEWYTPNQIVNLVTNILGTLISPF